MKYKTLALILLFPSLVLAQTPIPTAKTGAAKPPYQAKIFAKKKPATQKKPVLSPAFNKMEYETRLLDPAYYDRLNTFLSANYSVGKAPPSSGDKLLGMMGVAASSACAGVAAIQWLDAQGKSRPKTGANPSNPNAKTI